MEVYFIVIIIGFCSYFIWNWLFKFFIKDTGKRKIATWIATIVGSPLIYMVLIFLFIFSLSYYPNNDFDAVQWKNNKEERYELTKDLINSKILIGKSKKEIRQLLGNPENESADQWVYEVGFVPSPGNIDPDILEIAFKNGKVIKVSQRNT